MYELLALRRPFQGNSDAELVRAVLSDNYPRLRTLRPDIDPEVQRVIDKALSTKIENRYPSAEAFLDDLRGLEATLPAIDVGRMVQEWFRAKWADEKAMLSGEDRRGELGSPNLEPSLSVTKQIETPDVNEVPMAPVAHPDTDE